MSELPDNSAPADGPEEWHKYAWPSASALTWVSGVGNLPLAEVRERAVAEVAALEVQVARLTDEVLAASSALDRARVERDRIYEKRQKARNELIAARERLIKRFPLPPAELACTVPSPGEPT